MTAALLELAAFMPPEVLFNYQEINPRADQYSAAAVLYHLLTGPALEPPGTIGSRYSSLLRRTYLPIRDRRDDVSAPLAEAIHTALSRSPEKRFADVSEFRQALLRAAQGD